MFQDILNPKLTRRAIMQHAHDMGLTATVDCRKTHVAYGYVIDTSMQSNRLHSYCQRVDGKLTMSPEARMRQMQAETKMTHDFWVLMLPALARARKRIEWHSNDESGERTIHLYPLRKYSVDEMRLQEVHLTGRTILVYL